MTFMALFHTNTTINPIFRVDGNIIPCLGEESNVEKKAKGKQYHLFYNIRAAGKNIMWVKGKLAVLRIRIRIRLDPFHFSQPDPDPLQ